MSASKLIGDVQDDQIAGISGTKIIGGVDGGLIVNGSIQAIKIAGVNSSVLIGEIAAGIIPNISATKITSGTLDALRIPNLDAAKITGGTFNIDRIPTITNAKLGGESVSVGKIQGGAGIVTSINSSGVGVSFSNAAATFGRSYTLTVNTGTGSNQLAIGNHTHAAGAVANHTHTVQGASYAINNSGAHGHVSATGVHTHGVSIPTITTSNPSTLRLKKEIQDHAFDPKLLLKLNLKKYKYKNEVRYLQDSLHREWMYGYIAEEVQESGLEEILGYDKEGKVDSIQYGVLATLAIELIKQQQNDIDSLKEEIQRLKEKI